MFILFCNTLKSGMQLGGKVEVGGHDTVLTGVFVRAVYVPGSRLGLGQDMEYLGGSKTYFLCPHLGACKTYRTTE